MLNDEQHARIVEMELDKLGKDKGHWPWLSTLNGRRSDKKSANKFMLGAILDYQVRADQAWDNAKRLAEKEFGDPIDLWDRIIAIPRLTWKDRFKRYRLHRFPAGHERVWRIGRDIVQHYGGDARRIWYDEPASVVLDRLIWMGVGPQISRMIVGALNDTGQIEDLGDLKADLHVRRVLGRVFTGSKVSAQEAHRLARMIVGGPTWILDSRLYFLGKDYCSTKPNCEHCDLKSVCARGIGVSEGTEESR